MRGFFSRLLSKRPNKEEFLCRFLDAEVVVFKLGVNLKQLG